MEGFVLLGIEGLAEGGKAGLPPEQGWGHQGHVQGAEKLSYRSSTFMEAVIKLPAEICLG